LHKVFRTFICLSINAYTIVSNLIMNAYIIYPVTNISIDLTSMLFVTTKTVVYFYFFHGWVKHCRKSINKLLENTDGAIKNEQSRETGNTGHRRRRKTKQKHNITCIGHHHTQSNTNNVNKTRLTSYL